MSKRSGPVMLSDLVAPLVDPEQNIENTVVRAIQVDSRKVGAGDVFVAIRGVENDGHRFVQEAAANGAILLVTEEPMKLDGPVNVVVDDSARALAELSARYYGQPARDLRMFGITGTNGKTSTAHLFRAICERSEKLGKMGIIGTIGHGAGAVLAPGEHTTPAPTALHRLLDGMRDQDCIGVVMEVSSHAVRQQRTWGIDFEIGMLTNITRDHLDYHSSFDDYRDAKKNFCDALVSAERKMGDGVLVYFKDDENARSIGEAFTGQSISTSMTERADVWAGNISATLEATHFDLHMGAETLAVSLKLLGTFSVANAVVAAAAARAAGVGGAAIKAGLEAVERVPGRFDPLGGGRLPLVIVDYSHTPDSLENTLKFCRRLKPQRLITVFGCGGDRDRGKRPLMGRIAQANSDVCFVTSDNPRSEDPDRILEEILDGMDRKGDAIVVEVDRRKAIHGAVRTARPGDLVAICGKGHEDYQIVGGVRHHFDDREEAQAALDQWNSE